MEKLKHMKECLISCVQGQISGNLQQVDAKELGEAVDMIKDLEEAIYYATITKAMEEKPLQNQSQQGSQQQRREYMQMPNYNNSYGMNYNDGLMYNDGRGGNGRNYNNGRNYSNGMSYNDGRNYNDGNGMSYYDGEGMMYSRDSREGSSPSYRRMYMEGKEMGHNKSEQMKELENYMQELSNDITEMIADASQEERQMLHQKICMLATKIKP